jgi:hypothetical protein
MAGLKLFCISPELLLDLFTPGEHRSHYEVLSDPIPKDAVVQAVSLTENGYEIQLALKSEEFDDIAPAPRFCTLIRNLS